MVVRDLDSAIEQFKLLMGIDNFDVVDWPKPGSGTEATYYGKPAQFKLRIGFAQLGNLQLEVIQPVEGKSIYTDFLETHGPGLHHIRFSEKDFDKKVEQLQKSWHPDDFKRKRYSVCFYLGLFDTTHLLEGSILS